MSRIHSAVAVRCRRKADMGGFVSYAEKIEGHKVAGGAPVSSIISARQRCSGIANPTPKRPYCASASVRIGESGSYPPSENAWSACWRTSMNTRRSCRRRARARRPTKLDKPSEHERAGGRRRQAISAEAGQEIQRTVAGLSMANTAKDTIKTRKIAILAADGVDDTALAGMKQA